MQHNNCAIDNFNVFLHYFLGTFFNVFLQYFLGTFLNVFLHYFLGTFWVCLQRWSHLQGELLCDVNAIRQRNFHPLHLAASQLIEVVLL